MPDFSSLDSLEDRCREALELEQKGSAAELEQKGLAAFIDQVTWERYEELLCEVVARILGETIQASCTKKALVCLAIAANSPTGLRKTLAQWADEFGVSKQDMQEAVDGMRERLSLRKNRAMQDEEARENMRLSNFRPKDFPC